mgnify:CR=1 FL=1
MSLASCVRDVVNPQSMNCTPPIWPDYIGVTVPVDIAPMNFNILDDESGYVTECVDVVARGSKGGELHVQGEYADFDVDEWHELTRRNKGGAIVFSVCVYSDGKWRKYDDFTMYVSSYPLDDYGLTYRRIAPGYESGGDIGIYQRDIHSFDESAILSETAVPGQCMNCHTANRCSATQYLLHMRGGKGGTLVENGGAHKLLNTKTDSTKANCGYSYWHPDGRYIVSSINSIHQCFFVGKDRRIEVFDTMSDVLVLDTETDELVLCPLLQTDDWETYPVFSADGKTVFFSSAAPHDLPVDYDKVRYSMCRIAFDETNATFGETVDTILSADEQGKSFTYARPSYDGRWLMYNVTDFGNFPVNHTEADLWLMDLRTGQTRRLDEVNSDDSDSFHNWSSDSHWFVFSSRREDGMYNNAYIACVDDEGKVTKPFILPQKNPLKHYRESLDSYNCPDFTKDKVRMNARQIGKEIMDDHRTRVTVR